MRRMFSEEQLKRLIENSSSEVLNAIKDKDIQVNGITSKGIANTGGLANIGNVAVSGNIDGTGYVHANEIVENMTGYQVQPASSNANDNVNNIYIGCCKNGNKLTIVIFLSITKLQAGNHQVVTGIKIPSSVVAKLYPYEIGGALYLDQRNIVGVQKDDWGKKTISLDVVKASSSMVAFTLSDETLDLNKETYARVEQTFLLSDNMISQE